MYIALEKNCNVHSRELTLMFPRRVPRPASVTILKLAAEQHHHLYFSLDGTIALPSRSTHRAIAKMGWFDYVSDVYSSFSIQGASADIQNSMEKASGDFNDGKDQTALGTAQQTRGASVRGGVSTNVPHSGTDEESESEKEVNEQDVKSSSPSEPGHVPGSDEAKTAAGQVGKENAGPHGGPVGPDSEANTGDEADEDEDEDDDEPVDPKIKIEAGSLRMLWRTDILEADGDRLRKDACVCTA